MYKHYILTFFGAALWFSLMAASEDLKGTWRFCNGPEFPGASGKIEVSENQVDLAYDFNGGGRYAAAYCDLEKPLYLNLVSFQLRKEPEATLTVRITDDTDQTFQKSVYYEGTGYRSLAFNMLGWTAHWGGPNDGVLRPPIRRIGILVEKEGLENNVGAISILNPQCEIAVGDQNQEFSVAASETTSSYLVSDFGKDCVLAQSAGNTLKDKVWSVDFTRGESASMSGSLSLFNRPVSLTLRLRASAPGAALTMDVGAHFQGFKRTIGVLDGSAQEITVTVPPDGWEAYGAAHATLHYPLRLTGITLTRNECNAEKIEVFLDSLTCETTVDPTRACILTSTILAEEPRSGVREFLLTCHGWNLRENALAGLLKVEVCNWDGVALHTTEMPVALPGQGKRQRVTYRFSVPEPWRYIEANSSFVAYGQHPAQAVSTFTASLREAGHQERLPKPQPELNPDSPWGMGVYLYRYPNNEAGLAEMDRAAALAAEAGVKWTREEFNYGMIETAPGVYDFSFFDALVSTAHRHGISVYGLLAYWSPFAEPYTEEGIAAYCAYARAAARHFRGRIQHWEIYNEPNIFFWNGPKELYPVLLERAYAAIKEEAPEAQVLAISTAGIDRQFIRKVVETGAPFDALTVHPYRGQLMEHALIRELNHASALADHRPVWITEMGWSTQTGEGGKTEREQAQLLARCYLTGVGAGVRNMGWYNFRNDGDDPFYNEVNFGVLHRDFTPKAAYRALATVCRSLGGEEACAPAWAAGGDGKQGWYAVAAGARTAFWAPREEMELLLETEAEGLTLYNLMGELLAFERQEMLPPLPMPARGCRSAGDLAETNLPRHRYVLRLRKGDPVFVLGGRTTVIAAHPLADMEAEPLLF